MSDLFYEEFEDADPYPAMVHLDEVDLDGGLLSDDAKALGELLIHAARAADAATELAFSHKYEFSPAVGDALDRAEAEAPKGAKS